MVNMFDEIASPILVAPKEVLLNGVVLFIVYDIPSANHS